MPLNQPWPEKYRPSPHYEPPMGPHEKVFDTVTRGGRKGRVAKVLHPRVISRIRRVADGITVGEQGKVNPSREDQLSTAARLLDRKVKYRDRLRVALFNVENELR